MQSIHKVIHEKDIPEQTRTMAINAIVNILELDPNTAKDLFCCTGWVLNITANLALEQSQAV